MNHSQSNYEVMAVFLGIGIAILMFVLNVVLLCFRPSRADALLRFARYSMLRPAISRLNVFKALIIYAAVWFPPGVIVLFLLTSLDRGLNFFPWPASFLLAIAIYSGAIWWSMWHNQLRWKSRRVRF